MNILAWAVRLVIFGILLMFALQNTAQVSLRFLADRTWQAPLVIVLLVVFAGGFVTGALAVSGVVIRQRREISRLRKAANHSPEGAEPLLPTNV